MEVTIANLTQTVLPIATGLAQVAGNLRHTKGFGSVFMAFLGEGAGAGPGGAMCGPEAAEEASVDGAADPAVPLPIEFDLDQSQLLALLAGFIGQPLVPLTTSGVASESGSGQVGASAGSQPPAVNVEELLASLFPPGRGPAPESDLTQALTAIAAELQVDFDPSVAALRGPWQRLFETAGAPESDGAPALTLPPAIPTEASGRAPQAPLLAPQPPAATNALVAPQPPPIPTEADAVVRSDGNGQGTAPAAPVTEAAAADTALEPPVAAPGQPSSPRGLTAETAEEVVPARPTVAAELPESVRQVGRATLEQIARGGGEARIRLNPAELGQVTLHVRQHGDRIELDIVAQRPEAAQFLKDHAQDLTTVFGRQGLDLHVQVGLGGRQGQHTDAQEQFAWMARARGQSDTRFAEILGGDPGAAAELSNRVRGTYNPDGRHMYRI